MCIYFMISAPYPGVGPKRRTVNHALHKKIRVDQPSFTGQRVALVTRVISKRKDAVVHETTLRCEHDRSRTATKEESSSTHSWSWEKRHTYEKVQDVL